MEQAAPRPTLVSIQYLRGLAALLVLVHHARNPRPWLFNPLTHWNFTPGVEIFFVISGFIMYAAARQEPPAEFVRRRIIRVVPLYWIATLTFIPFLVARGFGWPGGKDLLLSLFMIPHNSPAHPGHVWPVLVPGWTLNYEVFFYGVFAAGLALRRVTTVSIGALALLVAAGALFHPTHPLLATYTSPILLAFLGGVTIAWGHARFRFEAMWPLAPLGALALLVHATPAAEMPKLGVLAASMAIVVGGLALESRLRTRPIRALEGLGDASYSTYLFHTLTLALVFLAGRALPLAGMAQFVVLMTLGVGASLLTGFAAHRWIERPLLKKLMQVGRPRPRLAEAPASAAS